MKNEIAFFEAKDGKVSLPVQMNGETVWLTQAQMAQLFNKDRTVIGRHSRNAIADGEIDAKTMCAKFAHMGSGSHACRADGHDRRIQACRKGNDGQPSHDFPCIRSI